MATLSDLGEREIIRRLTERYAHQVHTIGDDCAVVANFGNEFVVATTDPAPRPVSWDLGHQDYYYWGWLLAAINLSDINAAAARPCGFLSSLTLPQDMLVQDFERLLAGVEDCCAIAETEVVGGNIKEDPSGRITCEGTAFGISTGAPLSRTGAEPGDLLLAIGPTGAFWAALLSEKNGRTYPDVLRETLLTPRPLAPLGARLKTYLIAGTDASDGIYAAVAGLIQRAGLGAVLDAHKWQLSAEVESVASDLNVDPVRLALGFGDLQFVCVVRDRAAMEAVQAVCATADQSCLLLGRVTDRSTLEIELRDGRTGRLANFDNERFSASSQFTSGLDNYTAHLLDADLFLRAADA